MWIVRWHCFETGWSDDARFIAQSLLSWEDKPKEEEELVATLNNLPLGVITKLEGKDVVRVCRTQQGM